MIHVIHHEPFRCISCASELNASSDLQEESAAPKSGSVTICIHCGTAYEITVARNVLAFRYMDETEISTLDPEMQKAIRHAQENCRLTRFVS